MTEINKIKGRIISSIAGDYTVLTESRGLITCKARGLFRLKNISPCVGDFVSVEDNTIIRIHRRANVLVRPPLANLDCAVIVVSSCEPKPNALVIDRLTVIFDSKSIESVFVFTKLDKKEAALFDVYRKAGFVCFENDSISEISSYLTGKISALIGNTGVGKTNLVNKLIPGINLPTGEISKKLGRGKHTTRTVELHELPAGGYVADTPGFSTVETKVYGVIPAGDVALHFREFADFVGKCKFSGCTHNGEDGCAVPAGGSRYESYKSIYKEAKKAENEY
jgi:ribosome biogenesis GTPase